MNTILTAVTLGTLALVAAVIIALLVPGKGGKVTAIPLPWLSPPLTGNDRGHTRWSPFVRVKGEAQAAIRAARVQPVAGPVIVTLHWQIPNRIHRDADNLAATHKAAQDALVAEGVIPGDWWAHVPETRQRIHPPVAGTPATMWLTLTPQET